MLPTSTLPSSWQNRAPRGPTFASSQRCQPADADNLMEVEAQTCCAQARRSALVPAACGSACRLPSQSKHVLSCCYLFGIISLACCCSVAARAMISSHTFVSSCSRLKLGGSDTRINTSLPTPFLSFHQTKHFFACPLIPFCRLAISASTHSLEKPSLYTPHPYFLFTTQHTYNNNSSNTRQHALL